MSEPQRLSLADPDDMMRLAKLTGHDLIRAVTPLILCMPPSGRAVFWITLVTYLTGAAEGCMGRDQTRDMLVKLTAALDEVAEKPTGTLH